jgi:hypothetical protein
MGLGNTNQGFSGGGGGGSTSCINSVGLTMPSAFNVCNSPLTCSGTINVCGAGSTSQYIRGDGTLADFPSVGGGSSVNYYLNGSVNQGTFGGNVYYQMSKNALTGAAANFTRTNAQGNGYIASFITDVGDPSFLNIPSGNWNLEFYFNSSSSGSNPSFYGELYKVSASNVFTLIASNSVSPETITGGTSVDQYFTSISVPQTTLLITDRLAIRIYVTTSGRNITLHTQDNTLSEVLTTFTTGITALNGLTEQVQFFSVGTCGTDFNIDSCCATHTFNLPTASCSARGALSAADYCSFSQKVMVADSGCCSTVRCGVGNCASSAYSFAGGGCSNNISTSCFSSILGGSSNSIVGGSNQTIAGGYLNSSNGAFDFIGGGDNNYTQNFSSGVASGSRNKACSNYSFVGGGITGTVSSAYSSILGGESNVICISSTHSSIIGGRYNTVSAPFSSASGCCLNACSACTFYSNNFCACGSFYSSALTSGRAVCVSTNGQLVGYIPTVATAPVMVLGTGVCSTVRCGVGNCASGDSSFVVGSSNTASGSYSSVGGGTFNTVTCVFSNISGGYTNNICSISSSIVGGNYNNIQCNSPYSIISGGAGNTVTSCYGFIGGGTFNTVSAAYSGATGFCLNACNAFTFYTNNFCACGSLYSSALTSTCAVCVSTNGQLVGYTPNSAIMVLGSGCCSTLRCGVGNCASGCYSFAGGGYGNCASGEYSFVGVGSGNCASGSYSFVGGGGGNCASGLASFLGGGQINCALGSFSFAGGGTSNGALGCYSFVGGGNSNCACGLGSFVGGGVCNTVSASFSGAVGCCLNACSACTFYANNFCACGSVYSSALTCGCAVCANANGQLVGYTPSSGGITGSGTCNFVPKFTPNGTTLGNSLVYDNGTSVGINTTTPSASYKLDVNGASNFYSCTVGATVLTVQGSTGQLFTVSDVTTGNVFQVNDVSGLPLFAVNANGSYYSYTKSLTAIAATTVAYSVDKTTGTAAYFDYRVTNTTNSGWRAGTVMVVWDGTNVEFTDTSTNDITATTSGLSWTPAISGSNLNLTATITSGTWNIKIGSRVI